MKKRLLSMVALLGLTTATAQVYTANDVASFTNWTTIDADGDGQEWAFVDLSTGTTSLASQGGCAISNSWLNNAALTPDNIMISPAIDLTGRSSSTITWGAGSVETTADGFYDEHYAVYVVTDLAAVTSGNFPTAIYEGTLAAGEVMETKTIDISAIADNQSAVYVVMRHFDCTDNNFIVFDDVAVDGGFASAKEASLEVLSVYPNPSIDVLNITLNSTVETVSILSLDGKLISNEIVNANNVVLNVSDLASGVYFYEVITTEGDKLRNKFVKG